MSGTIIQKFLGILKLQKILVDNICFSEHIFFRKQSLGAPESLEHIMYDVTILQKYNAATLPFSESLVSSDIFVFQIPLLLSILTGIPRAVIMKPPVLRPVDMLGIHSTEKKDAKSCFVKFTNANRQASQGAD